MILLAGRNEKCLAESRNAFNRTYGTTNFYIDGTSGGVLDYNKQSVRIKNFNVAKSVLNIFGDLMQFLNISFIDINEANGKEIGAHVAAKCYKSLKELHLMHCHGMVLSELKRSFVNVIRASFSTRLNGQFEFDEHSMTLDEMMPNLNHLNIKVSFVDELEFVGVKFPTLRSLTLILPERRDLTVVTLENLFQQSPNVNTLTIHYTSLVLLRSVNRYLPKLSILQLYDFSTDLYRGKPIHFKNVNHLVLTASWNNDQIPEMLAFHQLRTLSVHLGFSFNDQWIKLFSNQASKSVEILEIQSNWFAANHLHAIAENLPNVKVMSISCEKKLPTDAIIEFLDTNHHLFEVTLLSTLINVTERTRLEKKLQLKWNIEFNYPSINVISMTFSR